MAWFPTSHIPMQYVDANGTPYSGAVIKAYEASTSTPITMAIDSSGSTLVGSVTLNAFGYPSVSGNVVLLYVEERYKIAMYPDQASADANSGAIWTPDNIPIAGDFGAVTQEITTTTVLDSFDNFTHIEASGTITITEPDIDVVGSFVHTIRNAGTGVVTLDGDGSETINGDPQIYLYPGDFALVQAGATSWSAGISRKKRIHIYAAWHALPEQDELPINGSSVALTSGGTYNGPQYAQVYSYAWTNLSNTEAPVTGGRGASAAADFAANKKITLPDYRDRVIVGISSGGSITAPGALAGASTVAATGTISTTINGHSLTAAELPAATVNCSQNIATYSLDFIGSASPGVRPFVSGDTPLTWSIAGSGTAHDHTAVSTFTGTASSVVQKSGGGYWYINF